MTKDPTQPGSPELNSTASGLSDDPTVDVDRLMMLVDAIPEVREQRIEELKRAMAEGTYQISPERIAEAMLAEAGWER